MSTGAAQAQLDPSFAQCAACHTVKPGENRLGPSLYKVVGRPKASAPGFAYSPAMKAQKGAWSEQELDAFITNPRAKVPGTRMTYAGMPDAAKRARLIAWLKTIK
ncbi:MAG TPA: c-type cytochrome [Sphingomonas sp.]|nr:c-type cytochrome [Sphingomonas sp.]